MLTNPISLLLTMGLLLLVYCLNTVLNVKAVVAAFSHEKALVDYVITHLRVDLLLNL